MASAISLPVPIKLQKMEPIAFAIEALVVHRLGCESVSDQVLAVLLNWSRIRTMLMLGKLSFL